MIFWSIWKINVVSTQASGKTNSKKMDESTHFPYEKELPKAQADPAIRGKFENPLYSSTLRSASAGPLSLVLGLNSWSKDEVRYLEIRYNAKEFAVR